MNNPIKKHTKLKLTTLIAATLGLCVLNQTALASAASNTFTPDQKVAIEKIVHDYLVGHPTVLIEATQALQIEQQKNMISKAQSGIQANAKALFNEPISPVLGNPKGNVTIVEFFDYQCNVCQRMAPVISHLINNNSDLRVVLKEWPIFGKTSDYAAKAALAAVKQNKFPAFYNVLMSNQEHLTQAKVLSLAKSVGLNTADLEKEMNNPALDKELKANLKLAEAMRLAGTPAFIVAKTPSGVYTNSKASFVPGATSEESLQELINQAKK